MRYLLSTILSLALLLLCVAAEAQLQSPKGRFKIDYSKGCAPYTVTLTTLNTSQTNIVYLLKYSSESEFRRDFLEPVNGNPQTFVIDKADQDIKLIQAITNDNGTVDRDELLIQSFTAVAPEFRAYSCSNNGAYVEIKDRNYDYYEVYFGGSNVPLRADATNNYTVSKQGLTAGTNNVRVNGRYNYSQDNCGSASTTVEVYPSLPKPVLRGLQWNTQAQTVKLSYTLQPQVKYQVERFNPGSGSYELLFPLGRNSTDTTFTQPGLATQYFCYRIKALDVCGNNPTLSDEICTASWQVTAHDGYNEVQYQTSPNFSGTVQIMRESGELLETRNTATGSFKEEGVICRQQYCYKIFLIPQSATAAASESSAQCVVSQSNQPLPAVRNLSSIWRTNNRLVIYPDFPSFYKDLNLSLLDEGGKKLTAGKGDSLVYNTSPAQNCYLFTYASACVTQAAPTTKVCPLFLQNKATEPDAFEPAWQEYTGYAEGVQYYVLQELNASGQVIAEWNTGNSTSYSSFPVFTTADNGRRFRVIAYPAEAGISPSVSNVFTYELIMKGYLPNAFSPNGDGMNDEFRILGKFVEQASLWVYNRWGEILFHSTDKNNSWNGTFKGELMPPGPYVYKAEVVTQDGKRHLLTGTVFLKR